MLKKHKLYVWGSVALIVLLSLFFVLTASASVSSPSGNIDVYDNINFTEASQDNSAYYAENQRGKYISVYSPHPLKGYANYYIYGADLELIPPNYSYTAVTFVFGGICNWTNADEIIAQYNTFEVTFSIIGNNNNSIYRSASVELAQGETLLNLSIQLSLEEFQQIGFGINGFVITLNQPIYSTQAIIYNPTIVYRYSAVIEAPTTPPPAPTLPPINQPTFIPVPTPTFIPPLGETLPPIPTLPPFDNDTITDSLFYAVPIVGGFFSYVLNDWAYAPILNYALYFGTFGTVLGLAVKAINSINKGDKK